MEKNNATKRKRSICGINRCTVSSMDEAWLSAHIAEAHPEAHKCPHCPKSIKTSSNLQRHCKEIHGCQIRHDNSRTCELCGKTYKGEKTYQNHLPKCFLRPQKRKAEHENLQMPSKAARMGNQYNLVSIGQVQYWAPIQAFQAQGQNFQNYPMQSGYMQVQNLPTMQMDSQQVSPVMGNTSPNQQVPYVEGSPSYCQTAFGPDFQGQNVPIQGPAIQVQTMVMQMTQETVQSPMDSPPAQQVPQDSPVYMHMGNTSPYQEVPYGQVSPVNQFCPSPELYSNNTWTTQDIQKQNQCQYWYPQPVQDNSYQPQQAFQSQVEGLQYQMQQTQFPEVPQNLQQNYCQNWPGFQESQYPEYQTFEQNQGSQFQNVQAQCVVQEPITPQNPQQNQIQDWPQPETQNQATKMAEETQVEVQQNQDQKQFLSEEEILENYGPEMELLNQFDDFLQEIKNDIESDEVLRLLLDSKN